MIKTLCRLLAAAAPLALVACAPKPALRWAPGLAIAQPGSSNASLPAGRTVRVETRCALRTLGRTMRFSSILVADSTRGRLEAVGPFGMNLATIVWQDSLWEVWLPSQGALVRGTGDSLSLPVVGIRTIRPRELAGPYIGRPIPVRTGVPLRTMGGDKEQVVVMPVERSPGWTISLDRASGLPRRMQVLREGREAERIRFGSWKDHRGVPVPDSIVRTGSEGQELTLVLDSWELQDSLPASLFAFHFEKPVDTIQVVQDGAGRPRYRIRPAGGSPEGLAESTVDSLLDTDTSEIGDDDSPPSDDEPIEDGADDGAAPIREPELPPDSLRAPLVDSAKSRR